MIDGVEKLLGEYDAYVEKAVVGELGDESQSYEGYENFYHRECGAVLWRGENGEISQLNSELNQRFFKALSNGGFCLEVQHDLLKEKALGEFNDQLAGLPADLAEICMNGRIKMNLVLNTPGGRAVYWSQLKLAMNLIKANRGVIDAYVLAEACSAGGYMFSEANNRFVMPYSEIMWHIGAVGTGSVEVITDDDIEFELEMWLEDMAEDGLEVNDQMITEKRQEIINDKEEFVAASRDEDWKAVCEAVESITIGEKMAEVREMLLQIENDPENRDRAVWLNASELEEFGMAEVINHQKWFDRQDPSDYKSGIRKVKAVKSFLEKACPILMQNPSRRFFREIKREVKRRN